MIKLYRNVTSFIRGLSSNTFKLSFSLKFCAAVNFLNALLCFAVGGWNEIANGLMFFMNGLVIFIISQFFERGYLS